MILRNLPDPRADPVAYREALRDALLAGRRDRFAKGPAAPPVEYELAPPFLFDCRFRGAVFHRVEARYRALLGTVMAFLSTGEALQLPAPFNDAGGAPGAMLRAIMGRNQVDRAAAFSALVRARHFIAAQVQEETGRQEGRDRRRMGLGDQLLLIGILQRVAEMFGPEAVRVVFDPLYPASPELFQMSGLNAAPLDCDAALPSCPGQTIDLRRHVLENPAAPLAPCDYGEAIGYAGAQALWLLGWHERVPWYPVEIALDTSGARSPAAQGFPGPYITCQPIELTRGNKTCGPELWARVLDRVLTNYPGHALVFGASPTELPALRRFVATMQIDNRIRRAIVSRPLVDWVAMIQGAAVHVTGNSSGLWLGIGARTPLVVIQELTKRHGGMWNARPSWFAKDFAQHVTVVEVSDE